MKTISEQYTVILIILKMMETHCCVVGQVYKIYESISECHVVCKM